MATDDLAMGCAMSEASPLVCSAAVVSCSAPSTSGEVSGSPDHTAA